MTDPPVASLDEIRAHFPALERLVPGPGVPAAYFDAPGGTQVPRAVVDVMADYLLHHNANRRWPFPTSAETDDTVEAARAALADLLGAWPSEIAFGANMTTLTYHLSRALGRRLGPGDEIVVTELDHQANIAPWRALVVERGVTLRMVPMIPETGTLSWDALEREVGPKTKIVAVGAASNALGTIVDVKKVSALARSVNALTFVDAVHYVPHEFTDVGEWQADFVACSAYKAFGPHIGILYGRDDLIRELELDSLRLPPAPDSVPDRIETGTLNFEGVCGAAAAVDFLASLTPGDDRRGCLRTVFGELSIRGEGLFERLWDGLSRIDGVTLFGPPPGEPRTPTLAFTVEGFTAREVAYHLSSEAGCFLSCGDFYASTVTEALGIAEEGLVRAGCACYTTPKEVDRLVEGVETVAGTR